MEDLHTRLTNLLLGLQFTEISFNEWTQNYLQNGNKIWTFFSEYLSAAQLLDIVVPLFGAFQHQLLVRLVCSLSIVNAVNSLVKWSVPATRPYWWIREHESMVPNKTQLKVYPLTCETSSGFPSSHCMSFATFTYIIVIFAVVRLRKHCNLNKELADFISQILFTLSASGMTISRLYFSTQFLHQCIAGSIFSIMLLELFAYYAPLLTTVSRSYATSVVVLFAMSPFLIYYGMLRMNMDPHWSVRMAFNWCPDPSYLRHEASPIFVLGRDFGFLFGVALSAPINKRYNDEGKLWKRIPVMLIVELLNYYIRLNTPKDNGRFIFVAYEFLRNMFHSFTLLSILPVLTK
ncbi:glucose-6-phosphatase 2 [Teleopsis dalmanni]|uniref:glucose-6-phosphatase 2 n=1 Tax=Teleopsis dalmanni TaxID=139649 RepID=UPI0018CFAE8F|nr:glucose-6-phosphatase 2 [Teleopsis dalmanni]